MRPERICTALDRPTFIYPALSVLQENAVVVLLLEKTHHLEEAHINDAAICIRESPDIKAQARCHSVHIILAEKDISGFAAAAVSASFASELQTVFIEAAAHLNPLLDNEVFPFRGRPLKWREKDSDLRRLSQQIYSLPPLTAREPLHISHLSDSN